MRLIAHRGLTTGSEKGAIENHPAQIGFALLLGYDVEVDVWFIDGKWWLGHNEPNYEVEKDFIKIPKLWLHCKNLEALHELSWFALEYGDPQYFWHQGDHYTLTSHGNIWTHVDSNQTTDRSVLVLDNEDLDETVWTPEKLKSSYGICSKWIEVCKEKLFPIL
jgi:hypothetical protein